MKTKIYIITSIKTEGYTILKEPLRFYLTRQIVRDESYDLFLLPEKGINQIFDLSDEVVILVGENVYLNHLESLKRAIVQAKQFERSVIGINLTYEKLFLVLNLNQAINGNNKFESYDELLSYYGSDHLSTFILEKGRVVNDEIKLEELRKKISSQINNYHQKNGVRLINPPTVLIGPKVKIGKKTIIEQNCEIYLETVIGKENFIGFNSFIENSSLGDYNVFVQSTIINSQIGDSNQIGPFSHIRGNTKIESNSSIGNFVELKNSLIHDRVKIKHHTYLGDTTVEEDVNIGCGVIVANYDGKIKHKTLIKKKAFIGSNVTLVAPLTIGQNALIAAGSTITESVDDKQLAIARQRQTNKSNYAK